MPFPDGDVPRSPSYGVYISQLIRFARVCSNVDDFNSRNLFLTAKLLKQGYRYHKIRKAVSKFYQRHSELIVKYIIGLKTLLQQGISEPIFYGDLVYKFKRIVRKPNFSDQFKKTVKRYIRIGYNLDIMRQSTYLVLNPITVYSYGFLFNCTTVGQASDLDIMRQSACLVLNPIIVYSYDFLYNCTTVGQVSDSMTALT